LKRARSEALLLKALDGEALYTIISGLKPTSSGFASLQFTVANSDLTKLEETRQMLSVWLCDDALLAAVHHFAQTYVNEKTKETKRFAADSLLCKANTRAPTIRRRSLRARISSFLKTTRSTSNTPSRAFAVELQAL
jgi:hypothetical protein